MAWYWNLLMVFVVFNVGFVCGTWLSGSTPDGLFRMKGVVARFMRAHISREEDLQVEKAST